MPKENFSNGSISTVDVLYPSSPMFLFLNPKLVEAQLEPVLRYAETSHWKFPFAPHDLGIYPLANGQLYGGGEISEDDQMPVEESGNMILMVAALAHAEQTPAFAKALLAAAHQMGRVSDGEGIRSGKSALHGRFRGPSWRTTPIYPSRRLRRWPHTRNWPEKLGITTWPSSIERRREIDGDRSGWCMAADGDHYRLAFDKPGHLEPEIQPGMGYDPRSAHLSRRRLLTKEIAFYKTHLNPFGLPLDNRATYTKLDWTVWSATLATNPADFQTLVHPVFSS